MPKKKTNSVVPAPRQKNWFGRECHDSDCLIHWSDDHRTDQFNFYWSGQKFASFEAYVDAVRAAWDLVHAETPLALATKLLQDAQSHVASMEQGERDAGEDL